MTKTVEPSAERPSRGQMPEAPPPAGRQSSGPFEARFGRFVQQSIVRTKKLADRAMVLFILLRLALIIASASLPALTTLAPPIWPTIAAVIVTILTALDTQFRWGEEWRHFRSTQVALQQMQLDYEYRAAVVAAGRTYNSVKTSADNLDSFYKEVEQLLKGETDQFFKFRLVDLQAKT